MSSRGDCMSKFRKLAVLSMLVVMLMAISIPASLAQGIVKVGANAAAPLTANAGGAPIAGAIGAPLAAPIGGGGFGAFGGFGYPFNWGFSPYGVGTFPFNWGLGGGWGPFPFLAWNKFSPGFFGCSGHFPFSPCFMGCYQPLPFILGKELGGCPVLGWDVSPWAFGLQSCVRSLPLYFNAHGFGFPKSLGNWRFGLMPTCDIPCPCPAIIPAAPCSGANLPAVPAIAGANAANIAGGLTKAAVNVPLSFILGKESGGCPVLGWDVSPWAFGLQSCVRSLPLYFNAHGFGFPMTLGNYRIGFTPCIC